MQMARGFTIMRSGVYTALPYALAIVFCVGSAMSATGC
jgi:hypothetical protein